MITEASMKANKLHIMHAAKLISKMKSGDEREQAVTELEQKAKKMGFSRKNYEEILDKQGAYEETMHKAQEEAEKMHSYMNALSLERSVNIWAEAAKKDEDLESVKGSKTLTKKTQEKVKINPTEREYIKR
jgi:membrane-bound lytic murein transglycosylase B